MADIQSRLRAVACAKQLRPRRQSKKFPGQIPVLGASRMSRPLNTPTVKKGAKDAFAFGSFSSHLQAALKRYKKLVPAASRDLLTYPQCLALVYLAANGNCTQAGLANSLAIDVSTTSTLLRRLSCKKLVAKDRNPNNRRSMHVQLLPRGQIVANRCEASLCAVESDFVKRLSSDERKSLVRLLKKVSDRTSKLSSKRHGKEENAATQNGR
jgi:DNA-binding MarR family transcriptional regulator